MNAHATYAVKLLVATIVVGMAAKLALINSGGCDAFDRDPSHFLAYCEMAQHGSYDDAAYLYDLEPGVREQVDSARLLVLGSSHILVALSSEAFSVFERDRPDARPYLLAFGNYEQDLFAARVIRRLRPTPKIVVVNVDPFFTDSESVESNRLAASPLVERMNALSKRVSHSFAGMPCTRGSGPIIYREPCGRATTFYRSRTDGRWIFNGIRRYHEDLAEAVTPPNEAALVARYSANAERFLELFAIDRRCVVFTVVPDGSHTESFARAIASNIRATFVAPRLTQLGSEDGSHLDTEAAERWSAAFLHELGPVLTDCLTRSPAEPRGSLRVP